MADETIKIKIETTGGDNIVNNLNNATEASKSLKAQLREATLELQRLSDQEVIDPKKVQEAAMAVGELKDRISEANENAASFAGNKFENVTNSLTGVKDGLLGLDFDKASQMANNFAANAKNISFGGAVSSLKTLGSTFMTVGKALLTNPLFLLGTAIALIIVGIVALLDKLGFIKKMFEAIGAVIDVAVQAVKDFLDFLGLTAFAAEDAAAANAKAMESMADSTKKKNEEVIQGLDNEIRMAKLSGKNTEQLERQKVQTLRATAKARYEADQAAYKAAVLKGDLDAKEIADLKEKARLSRLASKQAGDDVKFFEASIVAEKKKAKEETAKNDADAEKKAKDERSKNYKDAIAKQKEFEATRLATTRQIEDLKIALMKDGVDKELEANRVKYERLIADTKTNEKLLATEKKAITDALALQQAADAEKIRTENQKKIDDKKKTDDEKAAADAKELTDKMAADAQTVTDLRLQHMKEGVDKEIALRNQQFLDEKAALDKALADKLISQESYDAMLATATQKSADDIAAINIAAAEKEAAAEKVLRDQKIQGVQNALSAISSLSELFAGKSRKSQEKAFKVQKGVQIAQASIDTFKAATGAFSSLASIPVVGPVLGGLAAAAAVAAGLVNIKKIAATKFDPEGGGTPPSAGSPPAMPDVATAMAAPIPPSLVTNNGPFAGSEGGRERGEGLRQQTVKAIVVESDITNTQNRLSTYQSRSEIG
jgi:hypothetical protein